MKLRVKYLILAGAIIIAPAFCYAQAPRKTFSALKTTDPIVVDGKLDEPAWQSAPAATGFIQNMPNPGQPSAQRSEVRIIYDNSAVYIGALLYDAHPDSILKQLSSRDDYFNNNDAFGVLFDTYFDKQNGSQFIVTAAGVQADGIVQFDGSDFSWNAAWYSKVHIHDSGWTVEMKIPYSALRFPAKAEQTWGVNFFRVIRRTRERSYWNNVQPNVSNIMDQSGILTGINNIESPIRLAFLPYVSGYTQNYNGQNTNSLNGGMDIKYGINESFTLDLTLIPDFGQTLYDNKVLNLSPIEVRYDERRYFFTEGVSLFNKNDLFYSRRIGGTPVNYSLAEAALEANEVVSKNPATTQLYNAAKLSGRTQHRLGVGFLNAVTAETQATIRDTITGVERLIQTAPLTNYNVIVLDQALKNNSYITLVNTNVARKENSYNANVTAGLFKFATKSNRYGISGSGDVSQLFKPEGTQVGYRYAMQMGKISGNYTAAFRLLTISDNFNPNDLGYLGRNNFSSYILDQNYNTYKPFGIFINTFNNVGIKYYRTFNPNAYNLFTIDASNGATFRNFLTAGISWSLEPFAIDDYNEPRQQGRFYTYPGNYMLGGFISSDYRKKFALDAEANYRWFDVHGRNSLYWSLTPRYRFSDKLSFIYSFDRNFARNNVGFVNNINDSIYLGTRNVTTYSNTLEGAYIFTSTIALKLSARHYWSQAIYSKYGLLGNDGKLQATTYNENANISFNSVNVYMGFVWQFRPGSEMSVVYQNAISSTSQKVLDSYLQSLNQTLQQPQSNGLSVKIIYYLDYLAIKDFARKRS